MRIFYCDPGLISNEGHHANSCRAIVGECRRRGIEAHVFGNSEIEAKLCAELVAQPLFRASPYFLTDGDPVCGWLTAFSTGTRATVEDLRRLQPHLRPDDLVYVNSAQAAQLMSWSAWMADCAQPFHAVMEFGVEPGVELQQTLHGQSANLRDPRTVLYRFAAKEMRPAVVQRLHLATFDSTSSDAYQLLLGQSVTTLPNPRSRVTRPRLRGNGQPITVAFLGHQRQDKGYQLVPEILRTLAQRHAGGDVRFLVHNGEPSQMPEVQAQVREFAAACPRCTVDENRADGPGWVGLLDRSDLIVCPYPSQRFAASYSALACDAVANGIPFIGPAGTTLERLGQEFDTGAMFGEWTAASVVSAIERVGQQFDQYAARALAAADKWPQLHGPGPCLDAMLRLAAPP